VNGLIALKDNHIIRETKNPYEIKERMARLVQEIYKAVEIQSPERVLPDLVTWFIKKISELKEYKAERLSNYMRDNTFEDLKDMLNSRKGFITCLSDRIRGHQVCVYKFEDGKFYFKDSLEHIIYSN